MSSNSTRKPRSRKATNRPKKPYRDFPLSPHPSGMWQKKICGKVRYFGRWARRVDGKMVRVEGDGWEDALALYNAQAADLHAGRTPRRDGDGLTVADLCNAFLTAKLRQQTANELTARSFSEYKQTTDMLVAAFGAHRRVDDLAAANFGRLRATMAERWGPVRLGNSITRVKTVFKYGIDNGLIDKLVRFGGEFKKPGKAILRRHRAQSVVKMLEAHELHKLLDGAGVQMRAMILLGVNAGYGNGDVATLPRSALDLDAGWLRFPRPKTGIDRRCWLWPETVGAIREALANRPAPTSEASALAFVTQRGTGWIHFTAAGCRIDNVTIQFTKLLKALGLHREGVGFYTLRHVFRTVADAARDPVATDLIMGHTDATMGAHYRERIEDSRLRAVAEHVRAWLFGASEPVSSAAHPGCV